MERTRRSLFYLVAYLSFGGLGMVVAPQLAIQLLQARGTYDSSLLRVFGSLMIALAIMVGYLVAKRAEAIYHGTLFARALILLVLGWAWFESRDPLFAWLWVVVAIGWFSTLVSFLLDRRRRS